MASALSSVDRADTTRLRHFVQASGRMAGAIEPAEVVTAVLDAAIQLFSLEACSIGVLDPTGKRLRFSASRGRARVDEFEVDAGLGIAGYVAKTGRGQIVNDVANDDRFYKGIDQRSGFRTRALLCAPLRNADDEVLGVIEAMNPAAEDGFARTDLQLLTTLGSVAATALSRARVVAALRDENAELRADAGARYTLVTGTSAAMQAVLKVARRAAGSAATMLLLGESGTGKEVLARAVHGWSPRAAGPFVAVNCTALSAELLESELFGHEKGAFTGAHAQRKGRFELAHGGTLFLDEIGELAPNLQAKLLRALQDREFQRVGGERTLHVDTRVVAATNRDIKVEVRAGRFREDLFYRLNVVTVQIPPLRERLGEVPTLAEYFVERFCREMGRPLLALAPAVSAAFVGYNWPGNVRELQNVIERAVVLAPGPEIELDDLPPDLQAEPSPIRRPGDDDTAAEVLPLRTALDAFTHAHVMRALAAAGGRQTEAARALGLPQSNLSRLMKRLKLR